MPFHLFSDLPPEIRLQIWEATFDEARHVGPMQPGPRLSLRRRRGPNQGDPVALRVNQESRSLALANYMLRDRHLLKFWEIRDDVKHCSYINFRADIAFFYDFYLWDALGIGCMFFSEQEMGKIERLWIAHDGIQNLGRDLARWLTTWLPKFFALKEIVIEVKGLEKCRGSVTTGGVFQTVAEALRDVRTIGVEMLYRLQEKLREVDVHWEIPSLEIEDRQNLLFNGRLGR